MAQTAYEIPLVSQNQDFVITLAGVVYNLKVRWNSINQSWVVDIYDSLDNPVLTGIPMVTGNDLLEQFGYLGIGGELQVQTDNDSNAMPTYFNLGSNSHLFFVVNA